MLKCLRVADLGQGSLMSPSQRCCPTGEKEIEGLRRKEGTFQVLQLGEMRMWSKGRVDLNLNLENPAVKCDTPPPLPVPNSLPDNLLSLSTPLSFPWLAYEGARL